MSERITILASISNNNNVLGDIGKTGDLFWALFLSNLRRLEKSNPSSPLIVGRRTYELMAPSLEDRTTIMMSKGKRFKRGRLTVCSSIEEALEKARSYSEEIYVIGGAKIFDQLINHADRLRITEVKNYYNGSTFFPEINPNQWGLVGIIKHNDYAQHIYERKREENPVQ